MSSITGLNPVVSLNLSKCAYIPLDFFCGICYYISNMKFTFKKHPKETGIRAVGHTRQSVDIKLNGKRVGLIIAPTWSSVDSLWHINLSIKIEPTTEEPCTWKWITLKFKSATEAECRQFLNDNTQILISKFNLHQFED